METRSQKIVPNLWFDREAEEAVGFYTSVFENSQIITTCRFPDAGQEIHQMSPGSVMTIEFELDGFRMMALNGGPHFRLNPSVSFFILSKSKEEINRIWQSLRDGGSILMPLESYDWSEHYGWVADRYGVNWQLMLEPEPADTTGKITPLLFFTGAGVGKAEEAVRFYTSVFRGSDIDGVLYYGEENEYAKGYVKHAQFRLEEQTFMAMDSGVENDFPFSEAISFIITCKDQEEIDYYWSRLTDGGDPEARQCGWLKDKFGVSWQVLPQGMETILNDPDREKTNRGMIAVLNMKKIDMNMLYKAFKGS